MGLLQEGDKQEIHAFFFFQAEDGIRDYKVTGVQTCALPISGRRGRASRVPPVRRDARAASRSASRAPRARGHRGATSRLPTDPPRPRSWRLSRGRSAVDALSLAPVLPVAHRRRGGRGRCSARRGAPHVMAVRAAERRGAGAPPFEASLWMAVRAAERRGAAVRAVAARRGESVTEPPPFEASL